MEITKSLESLGFSARESKVYLALLDIGPTTTSKLIRETGIASSKIYDVLEKLQHKGLVTYVLVKRKKEFHASNPDKIHNLIKEKEEIMDSILPSLQQRYEKTREEVVAEIYKDKEGIKEIFEDILREGKDWYALGASGKGITTLPYYLPGFYKRMKEKKINLKILFIEEGKTRQQAKELKQFKNIQTKFLPKEIRNLMVTLIYNNKIATIPINKSIEDVPVGILTKSKESSDSYKDYFNWLWKLSKI
ncbi:MAG: helix-turn-helix domain-containing protein [archaeon]